MRSSSTCSPQAVRQIARRVNRVIRENKVLRSLIMQPLQEFYGPGDQRLAADQHAIHINEVIMCSVVVHRRPS